MSIVITPRPAKLTLTPSGMVFVFDNIWTPEGTLRYTLWTALPGDLRPILGFEPKSPAGGPSGVLTVQCDPRLIFKRGQVGEKLERYFGEPAINEFNFDIYDAPDASWILSVTYNDGNGHLSTGALPLAATVEGRLFPQWIKPLETTEVYGQIEFQGFNETQFSVLAAGQMKNAVEGVDYRWDHREPSPYFSATNTAYDAERTWALKFVPMIYAGLGKINAVPNLAVNPAQPAQVYNAQDPAQWTMPFGNVSSGTANLPYDSMSWLDNGVVRTGTAIQCAVDSHNNNIAGYWCRHVNARKLIAYMLDASYGANRWFIDPASHDSPIQFQWGQFTTGGGAKVNEAAVAQGFMEEGQWVTVNLASSNPQHWFLLPQAALGLYDSLLATNNGTADDPHPRVDGSWALRYKSALEVFHELCYTLGYDAVTTQDSKGNTTIKFLSKLRHDQPFFTTIVPSQATPTAFPESENGIKATAAGSFLNANSNHGAFDDWFSAHTDDNPYTFSAARQVNGYTVPSSAQNPNEMQFTLALGGPESGLDDPQAMNRIGWYSVSFEPSGFGGTADYLARTENFPTIAPCVAMVGNTEFAGEIAGVGTAYQTGGTNVIFAPAIRAGFTYTFANGTTTFVQCNSLRQIQARFNALFYVKSALKYDCVYNTIHRFMGSKTSPVPNAMSWKNAPLRGLCQLFEPADQVYYVKERTLDLDSWNTTLSMLQTVTFNRQFEFGNTLNWFDYTEDTGPHGKPPVPPPPPPPTIQTVPTGGTLPQAPAIVKPTGSPINIPPVVNTVGYHQIIINSSGAPVTVQYGSGEGTNVTLPVNTVYEHVSNGVTYDVLVNGVPGASAGGVTSFNTRTGAVVSATNDYSFSQISGTASLTQLPGAIPNSKLANSSVTVTAGTGMTGGGAVALGSAITLTNGGVLQFNSRTGNVTPTTGDYTAAQITNAVDQTGSYPDPVWIATLAGAKVSGNITGNAANVTGTVGIANGGTGQTSYTDGQILIGNTSTGGLTKGTITAGTGINVTNAGGSITITATGGGMSNPMTTLGDLIYENATPAAARLAGSTSATKQFLTQTGNGAISAAPVWGTLTAGDVPTLNQNTTGTAANVTGTVALANGGTGSTTALGAQSNLGLVTASLSGNVTTTLTTLQPVTGLSFTMAASQTWIVELWLRTGSTDTNGIKIGYLIPASATIAGNNQCSTTGPTVFVVDEVASPAVAGSAFNVVANQTGWAKVNLRVVTGASSGTFQVQFLKVTSGTATIRSGSYLNAWLSN